MQYRDYGTTGQNLSIIAFAGMDGSVYLMGWTGGYVLLALLLAPFIREFGKFTVPDFVGDRYYSGTARIVAVICALLVSFTYIAGQMSGVGIAFSRFLGVDFNTGILFGMGIGIPSAMAGTLQGFPYIAGSASALMGFSQMGVGVLTSLAVSRIDGDHHLVMGAVFAASGLMCFLSQALVLPRPPAAR